MKAVETRASGRWVTALALLALVGVLCLPNPAGGWFDGIPWSTPLEFLVAGVAVPFLLVARPEGLKRGWVVGGLAALLAVKVLLSALAPAAGWPVWVYSSPENLKRDTWQRTYTTLSHGGVSDVLRDSWATRRDFPLEWANANGYSPDDLWAAFRWRGAVRLPSNAQLVLLVRGAQRVDVHAFDARGEIFSLPVVDDTRDLSALPPRPSADVLRVEGEVVYTGGGEWTLLPLLVWPDGTYRQAAAMDALWQSVPAAERFGWSWRATRRLFDLALVGVLALWLVNGLGRERLRLLLGGAALATAVLALRPLVESLVKPFERTGIIVIGLGVFLSGLMGYALNRRRQGWPDSLSAQRWWTLWLFGPLLFTFFLARWWPEVGRVEFMSPGDDWFTYQQFGREIFIDGDWLQRAHPVFTYQPLYRYLVGLLHFLFGQSPVAQYLLNVWAILIVAGIVGVLVREYGLPSLPQVAAPWLYLTVVFGSTFLYQVERGLQEHVALLGVMLTAFWLLRYREVGARTALLAALIFAVLSVWTRLDRAPMVAALALLLYEPLQGGYRSLLVALWPRLRRRWLSGAMVLVAVALALLAVLGRNFVLGGERVLSYSQRYNAEAISPSLWGRLQGVLIVLSAGPATWNSGAKALIGTLPAALILWGGSLPALLSLGYRRGPLGKISLSLGAVVLGALLPYLFYLPVAYPPRWSVHLLPWAVVGGMMFVERNGFFHDARS